MEQTNISITNIQYKGKVVPVLNYLSTMPSAREGIASPFLISALYAGEWSASCPSSITPGERASDTHCIGDWVRPRDGVDTVKKKKSLANAGNQTPAVQPVGHCYTD
jgi:hypothetical protein